MASIAEWIEKIKTAIYGEEVRGAIWQSLEAMNTEVEAINVDEDQIEQNKQDIATNTAAITKLNSSTSPTLTSNSEAVDRQPWIHRRGNIVCFGSYFHLKAECAANSTLFTMSPQPSESCSIAAVSTNKVPYIVYVDKTGSFKPDSAMPVGYYSFVGVIAL